MIVQANELTPQQKAAIEELLGRQLLEREQIDVSALDDPTVAQDRQRAAEELRKFLNTPRKPRLGVSEDELEDAMLEAIRSERPNYRPAS
jgi:hypothetical protein